MIPASGAAPKILHLHLAQWHRQIRKLLNDTPPEAVFGLDAQKRKVCAVMPQDFVNLKSQASDDVLLLSGALKKMSAESRKVARQFGLAEPAALNLEPGKLAACNLKSLDDLMSAALVTDASQFVLLGEAIRTHVSIMAITKQPVWNNVDKLLDRVALDLQQTISVLHAHHHSERHNLLPCLESFMVELLESTDDIIKSCTWSDNDKLYLIDSIRGCVTSTLENLQKDRPPPDVKHKPETASPSFQQQRSYSSRSTAPFHMEPQELQACGRHAGNAFFGGPLIKLPATNTPMDCDDVFSAMKQVVSDPEKQKLFDQPMVICSYQALANETLFYELNNLKHDRVLILADMNSHYLTFRRDRHGQWYKLESATYEQHEQERIKPGDYLKQRTFHGYHRQLQRNPELGALQIICLAGENISGIKTDTTETQ